MGRRGSQSRYREWAREEYTAGIGVGRGGSHIRYRGGQESIAQQVWGRATEDYTIGGQERNNQQV